MIFPSSSAALSSSTLFVLLISYCCGVHGENRDHELFGYAFENDVVDGVKEYGQPNWNKLVCNNEDTCTSYANKFPHAKGWVLGDNNCEWCPVFGPKDCKVHRQSPIDLKRDRGVVGSSNEKECPDKHWMAYHDDTCTWNEMKDQFTIERHVLRITIPTLSNGDIACDRRGKRRFPRLDYSKGFPDWWHLQRTEISVPSQHFQEGKQYAAEVTLAHFYEIDHKKNELGHVTLFIQDYPDEESWPFLDKLICAWRRKEESVRSECGYDPAPPYGNCKLFRGQSPTDDDSEPPAGAGGQEPHDDTDNPAEDESPGSDPEPADDGQYAVDFPPPSINCGDHRVSYNRMCHSSDPCCEDVRSDSSFCWKIYENIFPGDSIYSACYHCCPNEPKEVGPPNPPHPDPAVVKTIQCSTVSAQRMCKPNSCCSNPRSSSPFCSSMYNEHGDDVDQICWYCCREPKLVGPARRYLRLGANTTIEVTAVLDMEEERERYETDNKENSNATVKLVEVFGIEEERKEEDETGGMEYGNETTETVEYKEEALDEDGVPPGAKLIEVAGKKYLLRRENFEVLKEDENDYFDRIYTDYKRRSLRDSDHRVDYEDVHYWPYEWMLKVGTEYYFRYEGTMLVPPCREFAHWRVLKDPIKVHPRQIKELNRLLAWRIAPKGTPNECQSDTAGVLSQDGNEVAVNRQLQYTHLGHRKVFCECRDWVSKFEADRTWCKHWRNDENYDRYYKRPYSFDSGGEW